MHNTEKLCQGMYVRCPLWDEGLSLVNCGLENVARFEDARYFYLGQIVNMDDHGLVKVTYYDPDNIEDVLSNEREKPQDGMLFHATELEHGRPRMGITAYLDMGFRKPVKVLAMAEETLQRDGAALSYYYCEAEQQGQRRTLLLCEDELYFPFQQGEADPAHQMQYFELQNPKWYLGRRVVSRFEHALQNTPVGFDNLVGMPVYLLPHQVDTVVRALSENPCRLMLADEVGMGKTIEALAILKSQLDRQPALRALLVVPATLLPQWRSEIQLKFWLEVGCLSAQPQMAEFTQQLLLVSYEQFQHYYGQLQQQSWQLLLLDEAHSILAQEPLYEQIQQLAVKVRDILLLSATPVNIKVGHMSQVEGDIDFQEQYYRLMMLLRPQRFAAMTSEAFAKLLAQQDNLQYNVVMLQRKLEREEIDWEDIQEILEEFTTGELALHDANIDNIVNQFTVENPERARKQALYVVAYISEFYRLDRGIIRHRRQEMSDDVSQQTVRNLNCKNLPEDLVALYPAEEETFCSERVMEQDYEQPCYDAVMAYAEANSKTQFALVKKLLAAVMSSPYAVLQVLDRHPGEAEELRASAMAWRINYQETQVEGIRQLLADDYEHLTSKMAQLTDALSVSFHVDPKQRKTSKQQKVLIFTGFSANIEPMRQMLSQVFGEQAVVTFRQGDNTEEREAGVARFQTEPDCWLMLSDESGGEGRNFQVADVVVHFDLPWSPATLEQRIGRLDRIGRTHDRPVVSLAFATQDSLEEQLLNLYDEGLNIFRESLCGLELVFAQLQHEVDDALRTDMRRGLLERTAHISKFMQEAREEVAVQLRYDVGRNADPSLHRELGDLVATFSRDNGNMLKNALLAWTDLAGVPLQAPEEGNDKPIISLQAWRVAVGHSSIGKRTQHAFYRCPSSDELRMMRQRGGWKTEMTGTFSRNWAVAHEDEPFLAPHNIFFDSLTQNAMANNNGRCSAMQCYRSAISWTGFILTWNVHYNLRPLLSHGKDPSLAGQMQRYLPVHQPVTFYRIGKQAGSEQQLMQALDEMTDRFNCYRYEGTHERENELVHLGQRRDKAYRAFHQNKWVEAELPTFKLKYRALLVPHVERACQQGIKTVYGKLAAEDEPLVNIHQAELDLQRQAAMVKARRSFYHDATDQLLDEETISLLLQGLQHPTISLDSMIFVQFDPRAPQK